MSKVLKFGGPRLPEGTHTFYTTTQADGSATETKANVGDVADFDKVDNAQHYIDTGLATLASSKAAPKE